MPAAARGYRACRNVLGKTALVLVAGTVIIAAAAGAAARVEIEAGAGREIHPYMAKCNQRLLLAET